MCLFSSAFVSELNSLLWSVPNPSCNVMFNKLMNTQSRRVTDAVIRLANEGSIALLGDKEKLGNSIFRKIPEHNK